MIHYRVYSNKYNTEYDLIILKHKNESIYRWCNLTRGHICECKFNSIEDAISDLKQYEKDDNIRILHVE